MVVLVVVPVEVVVARWRGRRDVGVCVIVRRGRGRRKVCVSDARVRRRVVSRRRGAGRVCRVLGGLVMIAFEVLGSVLDA